MLDSMYRVWPRADAAAACTDVVDNIWAHVDGLSSSCSHLTLRPVHVHVSVLEHSNRSRPKVSIIQNVKVKKSDSLMKKNLSAYQQVTKCGFCMNSILFIHYVVRSG